MWNSTEDNNSSFGMWFQALDLNSSQNPKCTGIWHDKKDTFVVIQY